MTEKQSIGLKSVGNARELGGYPTADGRVVKSGVLLRTAKLGDASDEDLEKLSGIFHVEKVIDLRSEEEINGAPELAMFSGSVKPDPDRLPAGAEYINLPILDMKKMLEMSTTYGMLMDYIEMLEMSLITGIIGGGQYVGFVEGEMGREGYSRLFRELCGLGEDRALLFHCTQGKDRTGVAAMLILSALGVSEEVIIRDYLLTNTYNAERIAAERMMLERSGKVPPELIDTYMTAMDMVSENTMETVIDHLKRNYGSVTGYVHTRLGVTNSELAELRNKFLTLEDM